jgi:hypothetical protein
VTRFLDRIFGVDRLGVRHSRARRMGIMYVIWNDRMWASYEHFRPEPYAPCRRPGDCSATARHRDHVHISLSRPGGRGRTSWYAGRL